MRVILLECLIGAASANVRVTVGHDLVGTADVNVEESMAHFDAKVGVWYG
jgi:hypothetical protein